MILRLRAWWRATESHRDEKSNSFALFVVMLPILLGAFGLGVDVARNVYIRSSLENALDTAVTSGAAAGYVYNGQDGSFSLEQFTQATERVYALNRQNGPGLSCIGAGIVPGTTLPKCWVQPRGPQYDGTRHEVRYSVQEQSRNSFLNVIGVPTQTYRIEGVAIVGDRLD